MKLTRDIIGDASFIGLECPSGIVDDCNDGTNESVPGECSGVLMVPDENTQCGSQCNYTATNFIEERANLGADDKTPAFTDQYKELSELEENYIRFWSYWTNEASK